MKRINEMEQLRKQIKAQILNFTPEQLAQVVNKINDWAFYFDDKKCADVKSVKQIIDLLTQPDYVQEIKDVIDQTGQNYFEVVFNI